MNSTKQFTIQNNIGFTYHQTESNPGVILERWGRTSMIHSKFHSKTNEQYTELATSKMTIKTLWLFDSADG